MSNEDQTNLNEKETFVSEEETEISLPPAAANFQASQPEPVQPVIPVVPLVGDSAGAFPQQPQVVYVAQPTMIEPRRSWGWVPAALALLVIATVAGIFIGAELYKRSIYAESSAPNSSGDVSPYADSVANGNKSAKPGEENSLADKKETGLSENTKSESKQINSISTGFAPIQKTDLKENGDETARFDENEAEENNQETVQASNEETKKSNDNQMLKASQKSQPDDEDAPPPPPLQRKSKDLQPKKVENIKDTENVEPPQRNILN